ncbi:MAG TPA: ABC transporter permease, partial [Candidatus Acidoferrales bacterium]|nr:ABC transporter permease [Candidatus Acidoferrales bacterium]
IAAGMAPGEARRRALAQFGGLESRKEETRDARGTHFIETLLQDIRFALRTLRKNPGFTFIAVLTLALGIGANTAIFSIVNGVLLRGLPVPHADQIVALANEQGGNPLTNGFSSLDISDIAGQTNELFSDIFGYQTGLEGLFTNGRAEPVLIHYVTGNFFSALGIKPQLGRLILPAEGGVAGADPVMVLGYSYWKNRFGSDPTVIGRQVRVNGTQVTIVGVAPRGFHGMYSLTDAQAYLPLGMLTVESWWQAHDFLHGRALRNTFLFARLKPGVTVRRAATDLKVVGERLTEQYPKEDQAFSLFVYPERFARPDPMSAGVVSRIALLFSILGLLLLALACANAGNLLLVRSVGRRQEMAVRASLGAGRGRLIRQLLTESMTLGLAGGIAGLVAGIFVSGELAAINLSADLPVTLDFPFDWRVFVFALGAALLTSALAGIVPALRLSRSNLSHTLRQAGRSISARERIRDAFVVLEISGALVLLIMAGLLTRSLANAERTNLGFDPRHLVNFTLDPHELGYEKQQRIGFNRTLLDRVRGLPGVRSASLCALVPFSYILSNEYLSIPGHPVAPGAPAPLGWDNYVSPDYFQTMTIPIIAGRDFTDADNQATQPVAIINQAMASLFWPNQSALGQTFTYGTGVKISLRVVGIAQDSRFLNLSGPIPPSFYIPDTQSYLAQETLQVRALAPEQVIEREVASAIEGIAPGMPVLNVETMQQSTDTMNGFLVYRFGAMMGTLLGLLGLSLAVIGIYGVISYSTSQRTHEIAIRMALGAQRRTIFAMVVSQALLLLVLGLAGGVLVTVLVARNFGNLLLGVNSTDPLTYFFILIIVSMVTLAACYIPARRAMKVDPMVALRYE